MSGVIIGKVHIRLWYATKGGLLAGEIHLDEWYQVHLLLLLKGSEDAWLEVMRITTSHVAQFVRCRREPIGGVFGLPVYNNKHLGAKESEEVLLRPVPKAVLRMSKKKLARFLEKYIRVCVVDSPSHSGRYWEKTFDLLREGRI